MKQFLTKNKNPICYYVFLRKFFTNLRMQNMNNFNNIFLIKIKYMDHNEETIYEFTKVLNILEIDYILNEATSDYYLFLQVDNIFKRLYLINIEYEPLKSEKLPYHEYHH